MKKNTSAKPLDANPGSSSYTDEELMNQAQLVADAFARAYNKKHRLQIQVPVHIKWDLHLRKPKTAGMACMRPDGSMWIELNLILLQEYPLEILNRTIPHEMAHTAEQCEDRKFNRRTGDHGVWMRFMQSMAQPVLRYHGMSTKNAVAAYKAHKKAKKETKLK